MPRRPWKRDVLDGRCRLVPCTLRCCVIGEAVVVVVGNVGLDNREDIMIIEIISKKLKKLIIERARVSCVPFFLTFTMRKCILICVCGDDVLKEGEKWRW